MGDWVKTDELFCDPQARGDRWAILVAERLNRAGLVTDLASARVGANIDGGHRFADERNLVVSSSGAVIDVECRNFPFFEEPTSYPYPTVFVDTVRSWQVREPRPIAIVLISQVTRAMLVISAETKNKWVQTTPHCSSCDLFEPRYSVARSELLPFPSFLPTLLSCASASAIKAEHIPYPPTPTVVARAFAAVRADFWRQEGEIAARDIERIARRRQLSAAEWSQLSGLLEVAEIHAERPKKRPSEGRSFIGSTEDGTAMYLGEMARYDLLTFDREQELGKRLRLADRYRETSSSDPAILALLADADAARDEMLVSNLRLVVSLAKRHPATSSLALMDLVQEGTLGLERAVARFNPDLGLKFSTYATWWIRQAIDRAQSNLGSAIRLPVHVWESIRKVRAVVRSLESEGIAPTSATIGRHLLWEPEKVQFLLDLSLETNLLSLDQPIGDGDSVVGDFIVGGEWGNPEVYLDESVQRLELEDLLGHLTDRERQVIELRVGFADDNPLTLEEIGKMHDLTRERIRQIESKALKKLRFAAHVGEQGSSETASIEESEHEHA